jgi:hypothetical protein
LSDDRNVFLGEELLHNKRCVARCVIVMQKALSLPLVTPLPPNRMAQPLQNLHVEMASNSLSRLYELMAHQTVDAKECNEHLFVFGSDEA